MRPWICEWETAMTILTTFAFISSPWFLRILSITDWIRWTIWRLCCACTLHISSVIQTFPSNPSFFPFSLSFFFLLFFTCVFLYIFNSYFRSLFVFSYFYCKYPSFSFFIFIFFFSFLILVSLFLSFFFRSLAMIGLPLSNKSMYYCLYLLQ